MINQIEKTTRYIYALPLMDVRFAWINRVRLEKQQIKSLIAHYESVGFERVEADGPMTPDGREVMMVDGVAMALRPEIHAERLERKMREATDAALAAKTARQPDVRESIAATTCPQMHQGKPCGGSLNKKGVCPSCVTGRMGYKYRYTCEACGFDIVTKTELAE